MIEKLKELKISIRKLSIGTGIPYATLYDNLHGKHAMTVINLNKINKYLDNEKDN